MSNGGRTRGGSPQIPEDLSELEADKLTNIADGLGSKFKKSGIGTTQIRNVFSEVKRIQTLWNKEENFEKIKRELILLKPKLAYASGRKVNIEPFKEALEKAIDGVVNSENHAGAVNNFFEFVEAIVAYHKYYEEKGGR